MNVEDLLDELAAVAPDPGVDVCGIEDEVDEDEDAISYDDEDFWEAIDLLSLSRRILRSAAKYGNITAGRKKHIESHCDDLKQFLDNFIELKDTKREDRDES